MCVTHDRMAASTASVVLPSICAAEPEQPASLLEKAIRLRSLNAEWCDVMLH